MEPVVLHIDTEMGFRGGQQQMLYLHAELQRMSVQSWIVAPHGSIVQTRQNVRNVIPYRFRGEADLLGGARLARLARRLGANVIHAHSGHALSAANWLKLFYPGVKVVASRRVDFDVKGWFSRRKYRMCDRIVCISHEIERVMLRCGFEQERLTVVHSGVDTMRFADATPDRGYLPELFRDSVVVGAVAAHVFHKDYPNYIEAARLAIRERPDLVFVSLGDGVLRERLEAMTADEPLASRFLWLGRRDDIGSIVKSFDIFVMPSKKEGLGTAVIDAMALGLPIAATDAGGIPEMIRDRENGVLVKRRNPQLLAQAILTLANNPELAATLGAQARRDAENFSMQKMAQGNLDLYRELLHG